MRLKTVVRVGCKDCLHLWEAVHTNFSVDTTFGGFSWRWTIFDTDVDRGLPLSDEDVTCFLFDEDDSLSYLVLKINRVLRTFLAPKLLKRNI